MVGDGYTAVAHCENADESAYEFHEPDAGPVYCGYSDEAKTVRYKPPTADEIREFLTANSLTGAAAAGLVHVDPRTFRRYMAHTDAKPIPFSVWFTLRTKVGVK